MFTKTIFSEYKHLYLPMKPVNFEKNVYFKKLGFKFNLQNIPSMQSGSRMAPGQVNNTNGSAAPNHMIS